MKILRAFLDSRCHFWKCPAISVGDLVQVTWRRVSQLCELRPFVGSGGLAPAV
ncbi:hypothetical protein [Escherichia coli]|uniref:hypothetical protein n=1 Tax=Escherichia coli TaxID=562 RepID=UPI00165688B6